MTRTKSSRALVSVVLAVLMAVAFMPAISYTSFAATAKKATKVTKVYHTGNKTYTRTVGSAWTLKYKLSPSKLTTAAKKVVWKSSNKSVVNVSAKSGNKAAVSFKKVGTATVTVYTKANKKAKATWKFKVVPKEAKKAQTALTGVTVSKNGVALTDTTAVKTGDTLKASVAPAGATASYQWYADDTAIAGATDDTYTVTNEVAGKTISVKATGVGDYKDTVESAKSAKATAVALTGVTITVPKSTTDNTPVEATAASVGDTLTATVTPSELTNVVSYQWYHLKNGKFDGATEISGATSKTYTLTDDDAYEGIGVAVTSKEADGKTVVKQDILGTMTTVVNSSKEVSVAISKDGKTAVKSGVAAKVGDTLTALVTPSKASDQVEYQWYKFEKTDVYVPVSGQTDTYKKDTVEKWTAISGETKSTYAPTKAGTYGVRIQITPAGQRAGYAIKADSNGTKDAYSWAEINVSAKSFENVTPYAYDMFTVEKDPSTAINGGNLNAVNDPFQVVVPGLTFGTNHDYTIQWMIQPKDAKDTEGYAVETTGATSPLLNPQKANETSSAIQYKVGKETKNAQAGDKLFAVITGADKSDFAGQTKESNKITLTKGSIASISGYYKVDGAAVADQQHQGDTNYNRYTATLMNRQNGQWLDMSLATTKNNDNVTVTWYVTNDPSVAQKYVTATAIDSTNGLDLADSKSVQTNLFQYAGSKDEIGGKYVVAVVSAPDYVGKLAITATKTDGTPFEFANTK